MCVDALSEGLSAHHMDAVLSEIRRGIGAPGTGDGFKQQYGSWDSNVGLLEEQPVLLTAEPSLQPLYASIVSPGLETPLLLQFIRTEHLKDPTATSSHLT